MVEGKGVATGQPPHAESTGKQQEEGVRAWVVRHSFAHFCKFLFANQSNEIAGVGNGGLQPRGAQFTRKPFPLPQLWATGNVGQEATQ